ncbi:heme-binding protein [Litoribacter alkaliphilus]|uniref:Heme-binding protein n=1 Tax=Litoribacter ruber TaxID=702568 RepID=A0AAP2G0S2_9BACT|nr:heme-binding protein [Litoribacter alkaliphilus]MBS9523354.1 heme-binding protein [Litoribacter alkaliphilus]
MNIKKRLLIALFFFSITNLALSQTRALDLEAAQKISDAAEERARQDNWNVVIAILDEGGHLLALRRMDGTQVGSVEVAIAKAKTSVYFKRSTKVFEDGAKSGNSHLMSLPNVVAVEGGLPIKDGDRVIGAIGISGVTSEQDGIIAEAALKAWP